MHSFLQPIVRRQPASPLSRLLLVLAGIILGQVILYGPALCGRKVLLPLDLLAWPGFYLPQTAEYAGVQPDNIYQMDQICMLETERRFAVSEIRAGRFPQWMEYQFAGVPFVEPVFSPFLGLQYCFQSPTVLARSQLLAALVAGLGAYAFFRRSLPVSFWPATIAAWCYPLTGFFIFWLGYPTSLAVYWFPWLLLAVDRTVRRKRGLAPIGLSLVTALVLVSGHLDVAGQVLLAGGAYALWRLYTRYPHSWFRAQARRVLLTLTAAWIIGFLLAMPYVLPLLDHTRNSARLERRQAGHEERPPGNLSALPQVVAPDIYGAYGPLKRGSYRLVPENQMESAAAAYAGLLATLLVAPLAWCSRRHRAANGFWCAASVVALGWCLNLPGVVQVLRLPGLQMLSHNRLVFVTSFGLLALTATGLEVLRRGPGPWRRWFWLPILALGALAAWCGYRICALPEPIATQLEQALRQGQPLGWLRTLDDVQLVQTWFLAHYAQTLCLCLLALAAWLWLSRPQLLQHRVWLLPALGLLMVGDLLWFGHGRAAQADPALYFPPVPVLTQVAQAAPGRVIGYRCLPAALAGAAGLQEVRGYDGVDPARIVELLTAAAEGPYSTPDYGLTQYLVPKAAPRPQGGIQLSPILDMLGVRYVIFRGTPSTGIQPRFVGPDYWVLENPAALPRVFVPQRVECVPDKAARLRRLAEPSFQPREVACVEAPVEVPGQCRGTAEITQATPTRLTVSAHMETPGLVVLADRWDHGWQASLNGQNVPILRVNHAVRGVLAPTGTCTLEFRYAPTSLAWGLRCCGLGILGLIAWLLVLRHPGRAVSP